MKIKNHSTLFPVAIITIICCILIFLSGCNNSGTYQDSKKTLSVANELQISQSTPTDIEYSLERYNLIRRAYWVNGMRDKANTLPCEIEKPFGYIILFTESGSIVGRFIVDGKVSSLNSFLTPDSEYYSSASYVRWIPDIDGSYGENDNGIFFLHQMVNI